MPPRVPILGVSLVAVLVGAVLAGCAFPGFGGDRGGWSLFEGGISCRDCERLLFSTPDDVFEVEERFEMRAGDRVFGWYESPVEAGTRFRLTWDGPPVTEIATRTATNATSYVEHEHTCEADAPPAAQPAPPAAQPAPPAAQPAPPSPASSPVVCVWDHTPGERLDAPRNGITIRWEVENWGPAPMPLRFHAELPGTS